MYTNLSRTDDSSLHPTFLAVFHIRQPLRLKQKCEEACDEAAAQEHGWEGDVGEAEGLQGGLPNLTLG